MATVKKNDQNIQLTFEDGREILLKYPTKLHLGHMLSATRKDSMGAADVIFSSLMIDGDKAIGENIGYCHQAIKSIDDIFGKQPAIIEWDGGCAEVLFADDKRCVLSPATRQVYAQAQAAAKINPLRFIEDILKKCWKSGDIEIQSSPAHLLGFSEVLDEFISYTGTAIKN